MRREVHQGSTLEYLALLPDAYEPGEPYPLLIWLHGFGADMHDLAGLAEAVHGSGYLHVLPNAPLGGFGRSEGTVRAWYERGGKESPESVRLAIAALDALAQEVMRKFAVPAGKALLAGFSQGGGLALRYSIPRPQVFAGLAVLSGSLRQADDLRASLPAARDQSIFLAHGTNDLLVPVEWGRRVAEFLKGAGYRPTYREYPIGHEISPALFAVMTSWIARTLPPKAPDAPA